MADTATLREERCRDDGYEQVSAVACWESAVPQVAGFVVDLRRARAG